MSRSNGRGEHLRLRPAKQRSEDGHFCVGLQHREHWSRLTDSSKTTFAHASYAAFRPSYPQSLYNVVLRYHQGQRKLAMDLGCGTGIVTRALSPHFDRVIGNDPSSGMIRQAREKALSNLEFVEASAESTTDALDDASLDCVVAGQAAHWFDFQVLWPKLERVVRPGGTVAFWGYKDHVFVDFPSASAILQHYAYDLDPDKLGSYWPQPGRSYVQDKLRIIQPPLEQWSEIERIEYEPGTSGPHSGEGTLFMAREINIGECKEYMRTWSSYHGWTETHTGHTARSRGGQGDVVDTMFDEIGAEDPYFLDEQNLIKIEWGSALILARRRDDRG